MSADESRLSPVLEPPRTSRGLRRFFLRHVPLAIASIVVLLALAATGTYLLMSYVRFETMVGNILIAQLGQATGCKVEIANFHWRLLQLEAEANGLIIHGREMPNEAPLVTVDRLRARVSLLGLWSPTVRLRDLDVAHPVIHVIIFPDGSTNIPKPKKQTKPNARPVDAFFDLKANHL